MKRIIGALAAISMLSVAPAYAAVSSTCGGSSCTLTELISGETITIDGVTFSISDFFDTSSVALDTDVITVTGSSEPGKASLKFEATPALTVMGDLDFLGADFTLGAVVDMMSPATITGASLEAGADDLAISGPGVSSALFDVDGSFLEVFDDSDFGELLSSATALGGVSMISALGSIGLFGLDSSSTASLTGFTFALDLDGVPEIPVPAALPLFLAGLAIIRRRRTT
ncbi:hypothetical protein HK107_05975 [Parvularcula sp. ZS-1/3]|uniref:VPLPA-CTERM sorting domain-containing protein n=2 Tax=Parvularcula mediterranea TaxID=2732508 RepID=A0A7Y3RKR0_9PROT|nr:hypothetical protein [Parvularcula mediterranea]